MGLTKKGLLILLILSVLMTTCFPGLVINAAEAMDAQLVSCLVPNSLVTDEVFQAEITLKNTGTKTWGQNEGQTAMTLVSKGPDFNTIWGTYFIIMGQGNMVKPGETFTFTSYLKAPNTPGRYDFSWRALNAIPVGGLPVDRTKAQFGVTVSRQVTVTQRKDLPPPGSLQQEGILDSSDFEYMGSFIPCGVEGHESTYTDSGLALRNINGEKHLLLRTGTYNYRLYELKIPQLGKVENSSIKGVPTAQLVRDWGELKYNEKIGDETIGSNGGMWLDEKTNLLYWTHYNSYFCGGPADFPQLAVTKLNNDGTKTNKGYWYIPDTPAKYKGYWGGITKLSDGFAKTYTGGRDLALGFGGVYSICGTASRGPALGAIARPGTSGSKLDLVEMMTYPDPIASPRDGSYFSNVGYWGDQPENPWEGKWTSSDICRAGVFIDLPDKKGYLAFVQQATGRIGYDYGGYNCDGNYQNSWYFYNLKDLGAAAKGSKSPTSIVPSSFTIVKYPVEYRNTWISGACFDEETRMIYVYAKQSIPQRYGSAPMIHGYRVTENTNSIVTKMVDAATEKTSGNGVTSNASTVALTTSTVALANSAAALTTNTAASATSHSGPIIADHHQATLSNLNKIPEEWIKKAKSDLHIVYGHTSHGSQIVDGMNGLANFKDKLYAWNSGGTSGALDLRNTPGSFGTDLGNGSWPAITSNYLKDHLDVNVVMWSWCGQVSGASEADIKTYLSKMSQLEKDFPKVKFVYMTGHTDGSGVNGNLNKRNEQIRKYCRENNKILFDFADIESYDPNGRYYLDKAADDGCNYDSDGNGSRESNWAVKWQNTHKKNVDWYECGSAHSQPLNANRKAYAAWYMLTRIAGWKGTTDGSINDMKDSGVKKFNDINSTYGKADIEMLTSKGLYEWIEGDSFSPKRNITRAEFLYLLVKALDLHANVGSNFTDVKNTDFYYEAAGIAKELGITNGIGNNKLGAKANITRQDMSSMMVRALKLANKNYPEGNAAELSQFKDADLIADYAKESLATLVKAGQLKGYNKSLDPRKTFTMEEAATVISRIYNE